MYSTPEQNRHL